MLLKHILITEETLQAADHSALLNDNSMILEDLFARFLYPEELPEAAIQSYYVEQYRQYMLNQGLVQFVELTAWHPDIVAWIAQGLSAMAAQQHLKLFLHLSQCIEQLDPAAWQALFEADFADQHDQDHAAYTEAEIDWPAFEQAFALLNQHQDLLLLNADYLNHHPARLVLPQAELAGYLAQVAAAIPDLDQHIAREKAQQPRYYQLVDLLCASANFSQPQISHCDPEYHYQGQCYFGWLFDCDQGQFVMLDLGSQAILLEQGTGALKLCLELGDLAE